jgi:serine/threonine protein kinase
MEIRLAGRYQIVRPLGSGGFGQTFLAQDTHLPGQPLCIVKKLTLKVKDPGILNTAKRLFDREAETLHRLGTHDRIPRLLASFEQDGKFYLVQELIEGQTLDCEFKARQPFNETETIALLKDILEVLAFVHQQQVIHRDLKPSNLIRRSRDGKIVLIDFGAVKEVSAQAANDGKPNTIVAIGTPGYMPSEQRSLKPHFSSDIYAVGTIGIQALTGLSPTHWQPDADTGELCCAAFGDRVAIHPDFANILDRMVRYDYRQRYPDATAALQALAQLDDVSTFSISETDVDIITIIPSFSTPEVDTLPELKPAFWERCQQELAQLIGPFAQFIVEEAIANSPNLNPQQFIEVLAAEIPHPEQARSFQKRCLDFLKEIDP